MLFGHRYFASVVRMIADRPVVTVREVARDLMLADAVVRQVFVRLEAAGLIERFPKTDRKVLFGKTSEPHWAALDVLTSAPLAESAGAEHVR